MSERPTAENDAAVKRCGRVTGKAFEPHYWTLPPVRQGGRRTADEANPRKRNAWSGNRRPEAVYDVICGALARWLVGDDLVCDGCLVSVMGKSDADSITVTRVIPPGGEMPA